MSGGDVFRMFGLPIPEPKTFAAWHASGYRICKGVKSDLRNERGEPLFTIVQGGANRKVAVSDLTVGRAVTTGVLTATGAFTSLGIDDNATSEALQLSDTAVNVLRNTLIGSLSVAPDGTLHVHTATAGTVTAASSADELIVEASSNGGISILGPDSAQQQIFFGSPSDNVGAYAQWVYDNNLFRIGTSKVGASLQLSGGAEITNLTLSGAAGAEITTAAGDVTLSEGKLTITDTANETALSFTSSATTNNAMLFTASSLTTSAIASFYSNSSDASTRYLVNIHNDHASATGAVPLRILQDSPATAVQIDYGGTGNYGINLIADSLIDGGGMRIYSNSSSSSAENSSPFLLRMRRVNSRRDAGVFSAFMER